MAIIALIGFTLDVIGKLIVAYTAMRVHHRFWQEHKVDDNVFKSMKKEQRFGYLGISFIIIGYFLQLPSKLTH